MKLGVYTAILHDKPLREALGGHRLARAHWEPRSTQAASCPPPPAVEELVVQVR